MSVSNFLTWKHHEDLPLLASANDHLKIFLVSWLSSIVARQCQSSNWCLQGTETHPELPSKRSTGQFYQYTFVLCPLCKVVDSSIGEHMPHIHCEMRRVSLINLWSPQLHLSGHLHVHVVIKECTHKYNQYFDPISILYISKRKA